MIKHEQELAYKILEHVRTNKVARTPHLEDLAEQYAKLCGDINARLAKCADYLARGMRSEAIHEAQTDPALLELVRTVQFQEAAKWRTLCGDLQLPVPPQLMNEVVERLRKELPKEQELEPLLRQYRRLVHQGRPLECVRILRQIIALDPANPVWKDNLAELEDDHYEDFVAQIDDALRHNDLTKIQEFYDEAIHPERIQPLPADITERLVSALQARQREALMVRAQELCAMLSGHLGSGDLPLIEADLRQWESLATNEVFLANAGQLETVAKARIAVENAQKARESQQRQQELFGALKGVLALSSPSEALLRQRVQEIRVAGFDLPDDLQAEFNRVLAVIAESRRRRRRLGLGLAGVLAGVLAVAGGILLFLQQQRIQDDAAIAQLQQQVDAGELVRAEILIEKMQLERPRLLVRPEFEAASKRLRELKVAHEDRSKRFAAAMGALSEVSGKNYAETPETVDRLLGEAGAAAGDEAQRQTVLKWKETYSQFLRTRAERANLAVTTACDVVAPVLASSPGETELQEAIRQLEQARSFLPQADKAHNDRWGEALTQARRLLERLDKEKGALKEQQDLLAAIPASAGNLSVYARNIQVFIEKYPQSPATPALAVLLQGIPASQAAASLQNVSFECRPEETRERLDRLNRYLGDYGQQNAAIWNPDARAWQAVVASQEKLKNGVTTLLAAPPVGLFNLKYITYRRQGDLEAGLERLYMPEDETIEQAASPNNKRATVYIIRRICKAAGKNADPETVHFGMELTSSISLFPNYGFGDHAYVIDTNNGQGYLSEQDVFLRTLVAEADARPDVERLVVEKLKELAANTEIPPVPRAWLAQQLATLLANATGGYKELLKITSAWKLDVAWIDPRLPATAKVNQQLKSEFEGIPMVKIADKDFHGRMADFRMRSAALSRKLAVGGTLQKDASGRFSVVPLGGQKIQEGWVLTSSGENTLPSFKIAILDQAGTPRILDEFQKHGILVSGQIFFVPTDGRSTPALFKERKAAGAGVVPESWPKNGFETIIL